MGEKSQGTIKDWVYLHSDDRYQWAVHKTSNEELTADYLLDNNIIKGSDTSEMPNELQKGIIQKIEIE